jgi:uncharacterized protein (TIGR00251 family)
VTARIRLRADGVAFRLRLTPKGGRNALEGWAQGADGTAHLKARVAAIPEDGKANAALIALLAATLGVSKSAIRIASGETARLKTVEIAGDSRLLAAKLAALGGAA